MQENFNTRQTLLLKVKDQYDEKSWEDFNYYYEGYIQIVARSLSVKENDLSDLTQEILLTLWKKLPDFVYDPEKCKFRTWMNTIIRNKIFTFFRTSKRYSQRLDKFQGEVSSNKDNPEVYEIAEEHWKKHITALAWDGVSKGLEESHKECFMLLEQGKSPEEVAELTGIKQNTIYAIRRRIVQKLKSELKRLDTELN